MSLLLLMYGYINTDTICKCLSPSARLVSDLTGWSSKSR
ncbi:hypothetical protein U716_03255 [Rhodobacter capsulatus B6]|nr:hypothetical protein U716_03255 [Rhodobacter capsulatus B6]